MEESLMHGKKKRGQSQEEAEKSQRGKGASAWCLHFLKEAGRKENRKMAITWGRRRKKKGFLSWGEGERPNQRVEKKTHLFVSTDKEGGEREKGNRGVDRRFFIWRQKEGGGERNRLSLSISHQVKERERNAQLFVMPKQVCGSKTYKEENIKKTVLHNLILDTLGRREKDHLGRVRGGEVGGGGGGEVGLRKGGRGGENSRFVPKREGEAACQEENWRREKKLRAGAVHRRGGERKEVKYSKDLEVGPQKKKREKQAKTITVWEGEKKGENPSSFLEGKGPSLFLAQGK